MKLHSGCLRYLEIQKGLYKTYATRNTGLLHGSVLGVGCLVFGHRFFIATEKQTASPQTGLCSLRAGLFPLRRAVEPSVGFVGGKGVSDPELGEIRLPYGLKWSCTKLRTIADLAQYAHGGSDIKENHRHTVRVMVEPCKEMVQH